MRHYTIIDFNEIDIRIYQPEKNDIHRGRRGGDRGEYHFWGSLRKRLRIRLVISINYH